MSTTQGELRTSMNLQKAGHLEVVEQENGPQTWVPACSYPSHCASSSQILSSSKFLPLATKLLIQGTLSPTLFLEQSKLENWTIVVFL